MKPKIPFDYDNDSYDPFDMPAKTGRKRKNTSLVSPKEELTMLTACEAIVQLMENSGLSKATLKKAQPYMKYVAELQQLTEMQALFLAIILNTSLKNRTYIEDLAEFLNCRNITILRYSVDLEQLTERHLLICSLKDGYKSYYIPNEVIDSIKKNECFIPRIKENLSPMQLMYEMIKPIRQCVEKEKSYKEMVKSLHELMDSNSKSNYVQRLRKLNLDEDDEIVVIILSVYHAVERRESVSLHFLEKLIPESEGFSAIAYQLINGSSILRNNGIVELGCENGLRSQDSFRLTRKMQEELLFDVFNICWGIGRTPRDVVPYKTIKARPMFYNERIKKEIDRLCQLISPDNYDNICGRLSAQHMPLAFTCLFYGAPGTGKTETVYQLACKTYRDVMKVDLSQLRDQYVGESEKQVKAVFERYNELSFFSDSTPILLFNEADAIFGRRSENVQHSVDKMENAIQNIILEEMEHFEGILIATTNLTSNFDRAFERRFLYKVNFEQPNLETRKSIWHALMPQLDVTTTDELAQYYNFSGGQIQNVARRLTVETVLYGEQSASIENLKMLCQQESFAKTGKQIGF